MDIFLILIFLLWLVAGVLVVRFVMRTGGTKIGRVAHVFGGLFTMIGIGVILIYIYASASHGFAIKVNDFILAHLFNTGQ